MTEQIDRRNPAQYNCKHEAEIGQLRAGYDSMAKVLDSMSVKLDLMAGQLNKVAIMEERHDGNLRELAKLTAKIDSFESNVYSQFNSHVAQINTKIDTFGEKLEDRIDTVESTLNSKINHLEEKLQERHENTKEKLYLAINEVGKKGDTTDRLLHKWIYWGGGLWAAFCLAAWLIGGSPMNKLQIEWDKLQGRLSNQELIINGIDRRLDRIEEKRK